MRELRYVLFLTCATVASCADNGSETTSQDEISNVELVLVQEECRQGGEVEAFGETWLLAEPAPEEWYGQFPIPGIVSPGNGPTAVFVARGADLELIEKSVGSESEPPCTEWANANLVGEG